MLVILTIVILFVLIITTKKYVDIGYQAFGFPKKHPLMYLLVAGFFALIGLAINMISNSIGMFILSCAGIYAVGIISLFFSYAIYGFFKSD